MRILKIIENKQVKQSLVLLGSTLFVMLLMIGINYFLTKILDIEQFGSYSLMINLLTFAQIFLNFGFFYAISRVIALSDSQLVQREYYGSGLILVFIFFLLMAALFLLYVSLASVIVNPKIPTSLVLISIPFGWVFLLNNYNELVLQGNNRIDLLSQSRIFPKLIYFLIIIIVYFYYQEISLPNLLFLNFISAGGVYLYILFVLKPIFSNQKVRLRNIFFANKDFGFKIYVGSLLSVGSSSLSGILIGYLGVNNIEVGFFAIATQLSAPLALIPNVVATSYFKKFVHSSSIDSKLLLSMYVISAFILILLVIFSKYIILLIYGESFLGALPMVWMSSIGSMFYGISDFYNRFLLSRGKGQELMKASFIVGIILLLSNLIFINLWGGKGASLSVIIAGISYLSVIITYYNKMKFVSLDV